MKNNFDIYEWRSKYAKKELEESNIKSLKSKLKESANEGIERNLIQKISKTLKAQNPNVDNKKIISVVTSWLSQGKNLMVASNAMGDDYKRDVLDVIQNKLTDTIKNESLNENEGEDPIDIITMDVPLFIRILEYSREDAQEDMDLHDLTEKAIAATKEQGILQMDDYDMLTADNSLDESKIGRNYPDYITGEYEGEPDRISGEELHDLLMSGLKSQSTPSSFVSYITYAVTNTTNSLSREDQEKLINWYKVNKGIKENTSLEDKAKIYWMQKVRSGEIDTLPKDPKAAFLAQMTKDQMDHDKETLHKERSLEEITSKVISKIKESKPGLWANIHAKQERGEKPSPKGSKAYKSAVKAGKEINKSKK